MTTRVLAVCAGNICRSPAAEAALKEAARAAGVALEVHSAGTGAWHVGDPPDPRMRRAAASEGLHVDGRAAQVTAEALAEADLVLAMDRTNLRDLERLARRTGVATDLRLYRSFDPQADGDLDVPDPYYTPGLDGFLEVVELVRRAAPAVIEHLTQSR